MKIALDARWILQETSGIAQHTRLLIQGLVPLIQDHEIHLLFEDPELKPRVCEETGCDWETHLLPYGVFSLSNQFKLAGWLRRNGFDLYHSTNYMMPLPGFPRGRRGRVGAVITIHDLIPMVYRDHAPKSRKSRLYPIYARLMREVAARADRIITVSHSSREDIIRLLGLPSHAEENVKVIYNGLNPVFHEPHEVPRHDPPEILYVGRLDPYKNVLQLISAFSESMKKIPRGTRLRIIGPPDERYPEPMALARQLDLFPYMDWEGHVDDDTLVEAFRRATVVVLPSEYEGFGLPVAEAMACGTPVICSNASSLPEVAGDAAITVPAGDLFALSDALVRVLNDSDLQKELSDNGRKQARRFQASVMAEETLKVYESLRSV